MASNPSTPLPAPPPSSVLLMPAGEAHAELWWRWRQEATTRRYNMLDEADVAALAQRLTESSSDLRDRHVTEYRWIVAQAGVLVGMVALGAPSWLLGEATISVMIAEAHQGQGLGTRAVAALIERAFSETPLTRLVAHISGDNEASIRMMERLGFVLTGVYPEHYVLEDRRVSQVRYVLQRADWHARPEVSGGRA